MLLFEMAQKMAKMGKKNSHEGVYHLKMASSSLFVFFNVHTDGSKWDLCWTALDPFQTVKSDFFKKKPRLTLNTIMG